MALTLSDPNIIKQKSFIEAKNPGPQSSLRAFFNYLPYLRNPDLKIAFVSGLGTADVVVSDSACKVYAVYLKKPSASTTDAWAKGSDHATVAAANGDFVAKLVGTNGGGREYAPFFADGLPMGTGFTVGSHTTVNGNTKSAAADAWTGFVIVGAP